MEAAWKVRLHRPLLKIEAWRSLVLVGGIPFGAGSTPQRRCRRSTEPRAGFPRQGMTIPDAAGFPSGRTRIRASSLHGGDRGLCPSLPRKGLSPTFRTPLRFVCAGGSPQSPFSPSNPPLARLRDAGGACFANPIGRERARQGAGVNDPLDHVLNCMD